MADSIVFMKCSLEEAIRNYKEVISGGTLSKVENEENEETEEENDVKKEEKFTPLNVPPLNFSIPPPENFSAVVPPLPNEAPSFDTTTKSKKSKKTSKKSVKN